MRGQYTSLKFSFVCLFTLFYFSGCSRISLNHSKVHSALALFIEMPQSINIFESLENDLYTALYKEFKRHNYHVIKNKENADLSLVTVIKRFDNSEKLLSPDLIPYRVKMSIDIECMLKDRKGKIIASKTFFYSKWTDRPYNVRLNSHFFRHEYKELLERYVPRIEYFFRSHSVNKKHL